MTLQIAHNHNNERVHIKNAHRNKDYYCPYCGAPLTIKFGNIRIPHYAHKANHRCSDSWETENTYDISEWHNRWVSLFPEANQEIRVSMGDIMHRADILTGHTVLEFQHSIMSVKNFDDRNSFYTNLGYKVIWLFDLTDIFSSGDLTFSETNNVLKFRWNNPKKAFNKYDLDQGCIDLFFQLRDQDEDSIIRVKKTSDHGFEEFESTLFMGKIEFLEYVGLENGNCSPPSHDFYGISKNFQEFVQKYHLKLNKQQERAVLAVDGNILILAVPGSGKTTTLISRLGYMTTVKKISPRKILALTYTNASAEEMESRYLQTFGEENKGITFCTINSFANTIYKYCRDVRKRPNKIIIETPKRKSILRNITKKIRNEKYVYDSDLTDIMTGISFVKNNMYDESAIATIDEDIPDFSSIYSEYQNYLKSNNLMDFDDQLIFAHAALEKDSETLSYFQQKYDYICVDEAQDTSFIQHKIIELLVNNNLFMVGDEDQSIYGFRGAYPAALLNFAFTYSNPYILKLEQNYRSSGTIVQTAQQFISKNSGRYQKNMVSQCGPGKSVNRITVKNRTEQYKSLLEIAKTSPADTAFLYRDNESVIPLVNALNRNNIAFRLIKPQIKFFDNAIVKDIETFLSLKDNTISAGSILKELNNKGILFLSKKQLDCAIRDCENGAHILTAIENQKNFLNSKGKLSCIKFQKLITELLSTNITESAINAFCKYGYEKYVRDQKKDLGKLEILKILASQEQEIPTFLNRLKDLEILLSKDISTENTDAITLSTIHTSKGKEFTSVFLFDVFDGKFPSSQKNPLYRSKDAANAEQEERRLFYVGITRAKNELSLIEILDKPSSYIMEVFNPRIENTKCIFRH